MRAIRWAGMAVALLALGACGGGGADDARVLHRGNDAEPLTLDPNKISMMREFEINYDLFVGLYTYGPDGEPVPGLAESAEVSEDGLTWTFRLREARWSDGEPITAEDAVFGVQRALDPATLNSMAINLYPIENAAAVNRGELAPEEVGVRALDERTVEMRLIHPVPYLPYLLVSYGEPIPKHAVEARGEAWARPGDMVTSGPYVLTEWRSNQHVRLDRNPQFYDAGNVCFDTVFHYPTVDRQAAERRVRAGELDANVEIAPGGAAFLRENHPELLRETVGLRTNFLTFNTRRPPFDDARVRNAFSMAIDRRFLADEVTRGVKLAHWRSTPPGAELDETDITVAYRDETMDARRARARALLEDAGYGPDNPLRFEMRTHQGFPLGAPVVQADWNLIAPWVEAQLLQNDIQLHYASMRSGDFDVGYASWTPDYPDPYAWLYQLEPAAGDINYSGWDDQRFQDLVDEAKRTRDAGARAALLNEAEQYMLDEAPHAPLTVDVNFDLVAPDVTGWAANPFGVNPSRWLCRDGLEPRNAD